MRAEFSSRKFYAFVGYGYTKTQYDAVDSNIFLWYGEPALRYSPPHDRRHQLTTMGTVTFAGFDFSALWRFGSGTPYTRALGFDGFVLIEDTYETVDVRFDPALERVIYGQPFNGRLPNYHRLDLSLARTFPIGSHVTASVKFDLINAYDRDNLLYVDLFTLVRVDQLPRFYSLGFRIDFR